MWGIRFCVRKALRRKPRNGISPVARAKSVPCRILEWSRGFQSDSYGILTYTAHQAAFSDDNVYRTERTFPTNFVGVFHISL